jgi:2-succinyl-5-enolpyruvyl-6-hydroxy-3-cyclohexene-1-carboxylate synthase
MRALARVASDAGWPCFAECTSQVRLLGDNPSLVANFDRLQHARDGLIPDLVVHAGGPLTSGPFQRLLSANSSIHLALLSSFDWPDPEQRAELVVNADPGHLATALAGRLPRASSGWREQLAKAQAAFETQREQTATALADQGFSDPMVFRILSRTLADGDQLVLGNSLPVRLADTWLTPTGRTLACVSQRGANGIDGLISSAAGASRAALGHTVLVLGDISALHDQGGLEILARSSTSLCVLIINNGGGRIFEQLPIAGLASTDAWITPHSAQLWRLGAVWSIPSMLVESAAELEAALRQARSQGGPTLIEARVTPHGAKRWAEALASDH